MEILFEDYYLLAINKPAGLSSESGKERHPSAEQEALMYFTGQLQKNSTSKRLKETPYLRAVHRLDRVSSGVLVFAKTKQALSALMLQFEQRSVEKVYHAVLEKQPPTPAAHLVNWLVKDESGRKSLISDTQVRNSQHAVLDYATISTAAKSVVVEVHPQTGRFHQIRAQLAHLGCPIVGDVLYGAKPWKEHQIKLHARRLTFVHPKTGETMTLEAPAPDDF
jgi:23S rRNA pseudouridine1911/1915/1917 synthase